MQKLTYLIAFLLLTTSLFAQRDFYQNNRKFTEADTLRGMMRAERSCYDVTFYDLSVAVLPGDKNIFGDVTIEFEAVETFDRMQIDLFENMRINQIGSEGRTNEYERVHNAVFITFDKPFEKGTKGSISISYEGEPIAAKNPPWDGGFVWRTDDNGNPWIGVACEGMGASAWWPNKDHLSDEPDSMSISVTTDDQLVCASNGNLRSVEQADDELKVWNWFVSYPINNYNVSITIGDFAHFSDVWVASDGDSLALDYYVLKDNLEKAKKQFAQVGPMLTCYEKYFGKYPFWEDGFSMIETPYLGMEHQSGIAYGNQYKRGYMGGMIPKDMDWDYIIIHEAGHEWWGNAISCNDLGEMWIHESFTTYMEALYVECRYGYEDAIRYLASQYSNIKNITPMVGPLDVNFEDFGSSDHYYKGAWMLHTLRHAIDDDELFFDLLKSFYEKHAIGHIHSEDFINYVNEKTGKDWSAFFEQYLYHARIPIFEYKLKDTRKGLKMEYRWKSGVEDFDMPIKVGKEGNMTMIHPSTDWKTMKFKNIKSSDFRVAKELFLVREANYSGM